MSQTRKPRGVRATEEGLKKLQQAKAAGRDEDGKPLTYERIAERARVDKKTVERFFRREAKDRDSAIAITNALNLEITEVVDPKEWNPPEQTAGAINWREVCGKVLAQQREEQRLRRQATERGFELNVYVPLGLVERKQQQRRRGDVPLEEVYQLTQEVITKEYDNDKFLTEVIEPGKSDRIAIIGEPGAGKTTLQEKIAVWIHDNNKGLPICIPLGGLQGKSLEDYLLQIWLKAALQFIEPDASGVEAQAFASLQKQFCEGKVWLLLDGVDEMAATSPVEALATIKEQLTDWLVEARVVLTCRLNVWDANVNTILTGFETYRTLEFKREQVEDFIRQWFACAEKLQQYCSDKTDLTPPAPLPYQGMGEQYSPLLAAGALVRKGQGERFACASESQRGEELIKKLQETGRERIRELVRNPLRLLLLCQTSYVLPVDEPLPETKAALYERFTRYFYEWKQEQHPTTRTQRRQLNQALGELAKAGINSKARFRLGEDLACDVMGEPLFDLACRLGWLNLVDRDANTDEAVYAFFHPTFQEYFAACAITDWDFFLNHVPDNPKQGIYRIFEPQWKEVILLWLGCQQEELREQKDEFIQALVEFKDGCRERLFGYEGFYEYRAYFLAAAGIAEFRACSLANRIVKQVVKWSFGENFNYQMRQTQGRQMFAPRQMAETAKITLLEMLHPLAVNALIEVMQTSFDEYTRIEVAELLEKIVPGQPTAIATLIEIMHNSEQGWQTKAVRSLGNIAQGNQEAIAALVNLLHTIRANPDEWATRVEVASTLSKIEPGHPEAIPVREYSCLYSPMFQDLVRLGQIQPNNPGWITALVDQVRSNPTDEREEFNRRWAVQHLKASDTSSPEASAALIDLIRSNPDEDTLREAVRSLGRIGKSDPEATKVLIDLSYNSQNWVISGIAIEGLSYTDTNPEKVINALIELICTSPDQKICSAAAHSLGQILQRYPSGSAVSTLKNTLPAQINNNNHFELYFDLYRNCYDALLNCAQNMPYPDFYQAWHQTTIH